MMSFVFRSPEGVETRKYEEGFFDDIFLNKGKEFWSVQSGDAGIHILEKEYKSEMVFIYSENYGFFIQHFYDNEEDEYVISHDPDLSKKVTVCPGGEAWALPVSFFCDRREALDIVRTILITGKRPEEKNWVSLWSGNWMNS